MIAGELAGLECFLEVARQRSFTKAAAKLGVSQSALSHTLRGLEERLGVRLLTRTTRSVAPTEAGARLIETVEPHFSGIAEQIAALSLYRDKPAGNVRITASEHAARTVLWPKLRPFLADYPDIHVEIGIDSAFTDIVTERYDAGVREGERVERDMIAVKIGPDLRMALVGAPAYLAGRVRPSVPADLTAHRCINLRLASYGGFYAWEFERDGKPVNVRVEGQLAFNNSGLILEAALSGFGLAFLPEDMVRRHIESGQLDHLLQDWCSSYPGYHLYYPSRRQALPAFALVVEALRYKGQQAV